MPEKVERCVEQIMKEQGVSEERAWAICKESIKDSIVFDKNIEVKFKKDPVTGFLTAKVNLARSGVQYYRGYEIGLHDRANDLIGVFRPDKEVFDEKSLQSFINLVVTDDHCATLVTVDNVKDLQKGQVSNVKREKELLQGVITITDKDQILKVENGKQEVSVGYTNDLLPIEGVYDGKKYEYIQTNIRANHLAIVDKGRCGPKCSITKDAKKEEKSMFITIDSQTYEVKDAELGRAFKDAMSKWKNKEEKMKNDMEEQEEEIKKVKKENETMKAQNDALKSQKMDDSAINELVSERAALLSKARTILGDSLPQCVDCPKEIKAAVIDHILPDMDLTDKSDDYVDAAYDMAISKYENAKKSLGNLSHDFKQNSQNIVTRRGSRAKYMKDQLKITEWENA